MEHYKIIFEGQYGFRRNVGTEDALFELTNILHDKRESKNMILFSSLHLEKAFDSTSLRILMQKLMKLGFDSIMLNWFDSYLIDIQQLTTVGSHYSNCCYVKVYRSHKVLH